MQEFRPRINNAIYMRLLWLTFVIIQCAFVFVFYTLLWGVSSILQVHFFHCTRLSSTLNIKSTKKRLGFGFLIIQLIIIIFFFSCLVVAILSVIYFLTSTVWLQNMYMYGVGIDNHEEQIFQESSNVCKMIFLKIKFASYS